MAKARRRRSDRPPPARRQQRDQPRPGQPAGDGDEPMTARSALPKPRNRLADQFPWSQGRFPAGASASWLAGAGSNPADARSLSAQKRRRRGSIPFHPIPSFHYFHLSPSSSFHIPSILLPPFSSFHSSFPPPTWLAVEARSPSRPWPASAPCRRPTSARAPFARLPGPPACPHPGSPPAPAGRAAPAGDPLTRPGCGLDCAASASAWPAGRGAAGRRSSRGRPARRACRARARQANASSCIAASVRRAGAPDSRAAAFKPFI